VELDGAQHGRAIDGDEGEGVEVSDRRQGGRLRKRARELARHIDVELLEHLWAKDDPADTCMLGEELSGSGLLGGRVLVEEVEEDVAVEKRLSLMELVAGPAAVPTAALGLGRESEDRLGRLFPGASHGGVGFQIVPQQRVDRGVLLQGAHPGTAEDLVLNRDRQVGHAFPLSKLWSTGSG
jgi:hypothetical protein